MLVTPYNFSQESRGEPILINMLVDCSGSMDPIKPELANSLNEAYIGALNGVNRSQWPLLRIHAEVFSDESFPLWDGFKAIWELSPNTVRLSQLNGSGLGGGTALFQSIKDGYRQLMDASKKMSEQLNNRIVNAKLIVLTDGANNRDPQGNSGMSQIRQMFICERSYASPNTYLAYFKTGQGVSEKEFTDTATACAFNEVLIFDQHGTDISSLRRQIRHTIKLLSDRGLAREVNRPGDGTKIRRVTPGAITW